jgi:hypothetical protein
VIRIYRTVARLAILQSALSTSCTGGANMALKLPLHAEAQICYQDTQKTEVLGPGLDRMIRLAGTQEIFSERLRTVNEERRRVVAADRARSSNADFSREGDRFVCAADDLTEAMFLAEVERLRDQSSDRRAELDALGRLLDATDLNPQWNDYARARIRGAISTARSAP